MMAAHLQAVATAPALTRLEALTPLDEAARLALRSEMQRARVMKRNHSLLSEGTPITRRMLILEGWAARTRMFEDGQLQIMSFLLPGDLIGNCTHSNPVSVCSVTALTDVRYCLAPAPRLSSTLAEAYAASRACEEAYLLAQIARLGRLTAEERLADLLLELLERLELCGLANGGKFAFPLTQNMLADATGLTVVHVNRMIGQLRRQDDLSWCDGALCIKNPAELARKLGRSPTQIAERG
jgi:CRP-like cAMP-binding protein